MKQHLTLETFLRQIGWPQEPEKSHGRMEWKGAKPGSLLAVAELTPRGLHLRVTELDRGRIWLDASVEEQNGQLETRGTWVGRTIRELPLATSLFIGYLDTLPPRGTFHRKEATPRPKRAVNG